MAVDFLAYLTGHTKSKINSEIQENYNGGFQIVLGEVSYDLWKKEGRLHLHHNLHQHAMGATFDFVTWRHDSIYEEREREALKKKSFRAIMIGYTRWLMVMKVIRNCLMKR